MSDRGSIVRSVTRAHAVALLLSGVLSALVSAGAALAVMMAEDDDDALALARTIAGELATEEPGPEALPDDIVRYEEAELRWFHRDVEVWTDPSHRVGGDPASGRLAAWAREPTGCSLGDVAGTWSRVCVARVAGAGTRVIVSSSLAGIVLASLPVAVVVALTALGSAWLFAWLGRRTLARALVPLARFEDAVAAHEGGTDLRLGTARWGADEVDRLARAFDELLERIARAVEREHRFVADAAHELRTPLTRLRGQIELAAAELTDTGVPSDRLALAVRSCEELGRTTESLLALARETASADQQVDLGDVARRLQDDEGPVAVVEHDDVLVRGDEDLLLLAARNLVDNARKYGGGGEVRVVVQEADGYGELRVEDSGPGIPLEEIDRLREPFVRGEAHARKVRGSGLGLALVDHVASLHEGQLVLASRSPSGLAAIIRVPLWASPGER